MVWMFIFGFVSGVATLAVASSLLVSTGRNDHGDDFSSYF